MQAQNHFENTMIKNIYCEKKNLTWYKINLNNILIVLDYGINACTILVELVQVYCKVTKNKNVPVIQ